ncbi:LptF/LptG family permease [Veillonella caviae]|uniref:LptF/LptG family permease n=1 Tax=Veillonella caviae TaxID=248316 RepID=UPI0023F7B4B4|nr:LptF/LptG family permease [Veillonella caviae]MCI7693775.1 LptF/LptG family permease [Veillonella caviae]MDD7290413.1 LptF/LptG family permease [Veillonella caviae]MDY4747011.1 LptF/LptG family permease [Veillonella caviae]MDY5253585.1 LptF/LptG family permease [Veillonella caviae]MDY5409751.1 LptF/LptG family permease [Veillonella caviae]
MRLLDKYILKSFIGPFLFGVFAFTSIFIGTGTLFRIAQYITEYGAPLLTVMKAFVLAMPSIIILTFPMSVLLGSLMAFSRLSSTSEIVVMRAGGLSFLRLAMPVYILALIISIGAVAFNEFVVPRTNNMYQNIVREEIVKNATPQTQDHVVLKSMNGNNLGTLMYAKHFDSASKELQMITVQQFNDNGELQQVENADRAEWNGSVWIMHDGVIYDVSAGNGVERTMKFKEQILPIKSNPKDIQQDQRKPEELTIKELRHQIKAYKAAYTNASKLEMEMYQRFTIPLASFVFALVGAPLGLQKQRSSSSIGFGISILIIFIYYGVMTFTGALGKGGALPTVVAAIIPDVLGIIAGLYLNWRVSR